MSSVGGWNVEARSSSEIAASASSTVTAMPLWPSSSAAVSPTGPAPAMMTWLFGSCARMRDRPRPLALVPGLERRDLVAIALGQRDVVPAVEQPHLAHRIDGEVVGAVAADDGLLLQIDRDRQLRRALQASP